MKTLKLMFELLFMDKRITDERLQKFSEDHIQRLIANNDANQYDSMINHTEAAHVNFFGAITGEETLIALKKGRTLSVENQIRLFKSKVSRHEGTIKGKFDKKSPEYLEFYPSGVSEYTNCTRTNIEMLQNRIVNAFTNHIAELGTDLLIEFTAMRNDYHTARGEQLTKKGEVSSHKSTTHDKRVELAKQLQVNFLTLAIEFIGNPERGNDFYDQSVLFTHHHNTDGIPAPEEYTVSVKPLECKEAGISFKEEDIIIFYNSGDVALKVFTAEKNPPDVITDAAGKIIEPDQELEIPVYELGAATNRFLFIQNEDEDEDGEITINFKI